MVLINVEMEMTVCFKCVN